MQEKTVDAILENVEILTQFIEEKLEKVECPMKVQTQIAIAIDEIFSNIARYAYPEKNGKAMVKLQIDERERLIQLVFIDQGIPYNPLETKDPDITLSAEERQIGGLGIFMVKKTMDQMSYQYQDNCNILTLEKKY